MIQGALLIWHMRRTAVPFTVQACGMSWKVPRKMTPGTAEADHVVKKLPGLVMCRASVCFGAAAMLLRYAQTWPPA